MVAATVAAPPTRLPHLRTSRREIAPNMFDWSSLSVIKSSLKDMLAPPSKIICSSTEQKVKRKITFAHPANK
jgi:hypothetical protein